MSFIDKEQLKVVAKQVALHSNTMKPKAKEILGYALEAKQGTNTFTDLINSTITNVQDLKDDEYFVFAENLDPINIEKLGDSPTVIQSNIKSLFTTLNLEEVEEVKPFYFIDEVVTTFAGVKEGEVQGMKMLAVRNTTEFLETLSKVIGILVHSICTGAGIEKEEFEDSIAQVNSKVDEDKVGEVSDTEFSMKWE